MDRMMKYIIKRELEPLDGSINEMVINDEVFDIVSSVKNSGLENIADFIIEGNVIVKSDPRTHDWFKQVYEQQTGEFLDELLFD